jgi:hypothetical protein
MFIWDFVADTVLGQIVDWIYGQIVGFLGNFFMQMGNMGAELFEMTWVLSIVLFFSYLAWALYGVGLGCGICQGCLPLRYGARLHSGGSASFVSSVFG